MSKDIESKFFETYLEKYADCEEAYVVANSEDGEMFMRYFGEYKLSCAKPFEEKTEEEKLADAFMFFIASSVIILKDGTYSINTLKAKNLTQRFTEVNEKTNTLIKK